jgi:hypothetical protein
MTRIQTILIITALGGGSIGTIACDRTPEQSHKQAMETQMEAARDIQGNNQEAQKAIDEAQREAAKTAAVATKTTTEAATEADKKIAEAQQQARQDNAQVQAKANEKIREANADVIGDKAELRVWGQKKLDSLNNLIDGARVKAQKAPAKVLASFEAGLKEVQTKRDALAAELASVEAQGAQKATEFKTRLNTEVDQLKARVEKLECSL